MPQKEIARSPWLVSHFDHNMKLERSTNLYMDNRLITLLVILIILFILALALILVLVSWRSECSKDSIIVVNNILI